MAQFKIDETHSWAGEWFLPEAPNRQIGGTLHWEEEARLDLNDTLEPMRSGPIEDQPGERVPTIHGIASSGQRVSLMRSQRVRWSLNIGSGALRCPTSYRTSWLIVGAHVTEGTLYQSVQFEVPGLELWLSQNWFQASSTGEDIRIDLSTPIAHNVRIDGPSCEIELKVRVQTGPFKENSIGAKAIGTVTTKSDAGETIEWHLEQFGKAIALAMMVGGSSFAPSLVRARLDRASPPIDVLVAMRSSKRCTFGRRSDFYMLATGTDLDLNALMLRWFSIFDSLEMPIQLALSAFASSDLWPHVEFLTLMQCLEGFHRSIYPGNYMNKEEYALVSERIIDTFPPEISSDHRKSLKSRIRYGNEVSLFKRLSELCRCLEPQLRSTILGRSGTVPIRWVETRNYYTHWDESARDKVLDNAELHYVSLRLKHWLRALYLNHLGIADDVILRSVHGTHKDSQYLLQINGASMGRVQKGILSD